jgi:hypothetical protein
MAVLPQDIEVYKWKESSIAEVHGTDKDVTNERLIVIDEVTLLAYDSKENQITDVYLSNYLTDLELTTEVFPESLTLNDFMKSHTPEKLLLIPYLSGRIIR